MQIAEKPIKERVFVVQSLREQVCEYLKNEINRGNLRPGSFINMSQLTKDLGISKTPLRDAMIQLECEGFVEILPRRGIQVRKISFEDVKNTWEICKTLEAEVLLAVFDQIEQTHLNEMEALNIRMKEAANSGDPEMFYRSNVAFHLVFLELSTNVELKRIVALYKQRLYDFCDLIPVKEWELKHCLEHETLIELIRSGDKVATTTYLKDEHWSFESQRRFIQFFYGDNPDQ